MITFKALLLNKLSVLSLAGVLALGVSACGKKSDSEGGAAAANASRPAGNPWVTSPEKVVQGLMAAYESRNDSLYASLLADEFRYYFEPPGASPDDILGWGKEEDLVATGNLFRTSDVSRLSLTLNAGSAQPVTGRQGEWMMIPVAGGELRVEVRDKEPMVVTLNRQEIYVHKKGSAWQVAEWRDYPDPSAP